MAIRFPTWVAISYMGGTYLGVHKAKAAGNSYSLDLRPPRPPSTLPYLGAALIWALVQPRDPAPLWELTSRVSRMISEAILRSASMT
jgi:hypothetical protein